MKNEHQIKIQNAFRKALATQNLDKVLKMLSHSNIDKALSPYQFECAVALGIERSHFQLLDQSFSRCHLEGKCKGLSLSIKQEDPTVFKYLLSQLDPTKTYDHSNEFNALLQLCVRFRNLPALAELLPLSNPQYHESMALRTAVSGNVQDCVLALMAKREYVFHRTTKNDLLRLVQQPLKAHYEELFNAQFERWALEEATPALTSTASEAPSKMRL